MLCILNVLFRLECWEYTVKTSNYQESTAGEFPIWETTCSGIHGGEPNGKWVIEHMTGSLMKLGMACKQVSRPFTPNVLTRGSGNDKV